MSLAAVAPGGTVATPRLAIEKLRTALLWLMGFAGAFVFIEPSPYEIVGLIVILVFAASGLSLPRPIAPLVLFLILYIIGFAIAVIQVSDEQKPVTWVLISAFLATMQCSTRRCSAPIPRFGSSGSCAARLLPP